MCLGQFTRHRHPGRALLALASPYLCHKLPERRFVIFEDLSTFLSGWEWKNLHIRSGALGIRKVSWGTHASKPT